MKKKILVTGGTGYIGSHTVVELIEEGFDVIIIDNLYNSEAEVIERIQKITGVKPVLEVFDLCDKQKLDEFFRKYKNISAVIHFAAYKAVGESVNKPLDYYRNNLLSLINLLDAMKHFSISDIVFSSSCTVYGQPKELPVTEDAPFQPATSPYGNTKQIGESIIAEFGTGIVMICTFGDKTDIEWWKKYKLPLKIILTKEGRLNDLAGKFKGQKLNEARKNIIEDLKSEKLLERQEKLHQTVGVCWRCGAAVEFLVSSQWRLILLKNKQKFLESARKIKWHPEFFLKRCEDWINNLNWDWVISRQRHYGVPMPVWYCKKCKKPLIADESQLPVDPQKVLPKKKCSCGSNSFIPSEDVFDTWFISSMTPEIVLQWVNKSKLFEKNFPEDLRPQGYEIIRTWAFYTIVKAAYHFNNIPWKNIIVHGMVLDPKGKAMHKSLGNAIEPVDLVNKFCADALRFWSCSAKIGEDLPIQEKELASGQKTITKLWNASKFAFMNLEGYKQEKLKSLEIMDRWIVSKLQGLIKKCEDGFENYDLFTPKTETENFFWHVFCDNYLEIIKKRIYEPSSKEEKISAQYTLYQSLLTILKLMAPIMPHITEELYQKYYRKNEKTKSIHISKWPEFDKKLVDEKIEKIGDKFIEILGKVRQIKTKNQKSLKAEIILAVEKDDLRILNPVLKDLKAVTSALEIKEGGFDVTFV